MSEVPSAAAPSGSHGGRYELTDRDTGCWAVRTYTGAYLLDLTRRRLMRQPAILTDTSHGHQQSLTWTFDVDGTWLPLIELEECRLGAYMRATVQIEDADQPLRSSPVLTISHTEQGGSDRSP